MDSKFLEFAFAKFGLYRSVVLSWSTPMRSIGWSFLTKFTKDFGHLGVVYAGFHCGGTTPSMCTQNTWHPFVGYLPSPNLTPLQYSPAGWLRGADHFHCFHDSPNSLRLPYADMKACIRGDALQKALALPKGPLPCQVWQLGMGVKPHLWPKRLLFSHHFFWVSESLNATYFCDQNGHTALFFRVRPWMERAMPWLIDVRVRCCGHVPSSLL